MRCLVIPLIMLFLVLVKMSAWQEPAAAQTAQVKARTAIAVWDTGRPAAAALAPAAIAGENDWSRIPLGKPADSFQGDAILSNGRIAVVLRKLDRAVEVYSLKPSGAVARLRLQLLSATEAADRLEQIALVERNRSSARLEVTFRTAEGAKIVSRFRLKRGEVAVQVEPGDGAIGLRVECPGRFVVLPEFFANDVTIDAADLPLERVALPNDNIVLHLTGQGEAIGMCFFEKRKQDAQVTLGGTGRERRITGSEISFEGQKIWVAVMEAPRIWHTHELMSSDSGKVI
ncbi:MAG: hypothetical protein QGG36_08465, partial [Pirellulaceae bacterium]|nr:hypothetical protein [Pirellulaceae bacterium]